MSEVKPVRPTRTAKQTTGDERRPAHPVEIQEYPRTWAKVIDGVLEMDVERIHARLEETIAEKVPVTGSVLLASMDSVQSNYLDACKLKNRARREYELYKIEYEQWLEVKKSAARIALEEEKKEKEFKKQITNDMILDQVRVTWADEYRSRQSKVLDFQSAVHTLEELADAWKSRSRTLSDMTQIVINLGPTSPRK